MDPKSMSLDDLIKRERHHKKGGFGGRGGRGDRGGRGGFRGDRGDRGGFRGGRGNQNIVPRLRKGAGIFKRREEGGEIRGGRFRGNRGGARNQRVRIGY